MRTSQLRRTKRPTFDGVLLLDADTGYLHPALSYSRSGPIMLPQPDGSIATIAADGLPRYWHQTAGWLYRMDPGYTQPLLYTHDLGNGYWTKSALVTAPSLSGLGPNGAADAWVLTEDTTSTQHSVQRSGLSLTLGSSYCLTLVIGAKDAGTRRNVRVNASGGPWGGTAQTFWIHTGTGAVTSVSGSPTVASVRSLANGLFVVRVILPVTTASSTTALTVSAANGTGAASYAGDGVSGIRVWALNLTPTSYPAPIVRADASAAMVGAHSWTASLAALGLSGAGAVSAGIAYVSESEAAPRLRTVLQVDDGSVNNRLILRTNAVAGQAAGVIVASAATTYNAAMAAADGGRRQAAMSAAAGSPGVAWDGAASVGGGSHPGFGAPLTTVRLGHDSAGATVLSGGIKRAWVSARALADNYRRAMTA